MRDILTRAQEEGVCRVADCDEETDSDYCIIHEERLEYLRGEVGDA